MRRVAVTMPEHPSAHEFRPQRRQTRSLDTLDPKDDVSSSADSSYSGVPPQSWSGLPLLTDTDKAKIFGHAPSPSAGVFDCSLGHPPFWQERKPAAFYKVLLAEWKVTSVVDMTPGTGQLARACMEAGIAYVGFAKNAEHLSWLQKVLTKRAVQTIVRSGTALHDALFFFPPPFSVADSVADPPQ